MRKLVLVFLLAGCGTDDKGTAPPPPTPRPMVTPDAGPSPAQIADAQAKCAQFRDVFCTKVLDCVMSKDRVADLATCRSSFANQLDCGRVVAVSASYARCLMELTDETCPAFLPMPGAAANTPASCREVLLTR